MNLVEAGRFWRTLRHLRFSQIWARAQFRLARVRIDHSPPPDLRPMTASWVEPPARISTLVGPTRFRLLNREAELCDCGWDNPKLSKLWRYNQHYFDDLTARDWRRRSLWHGRLLARWIDDNRPGMGTGWEPYPTSQRIVNWIKWSLSGGELSVEAQASLAVQARWLMQRLEWHLLGNHLFANAKALIFAGLYFNGPEADLWKRQGFDILIPQLDEQFLSDGAQFELSTMYHALGVEDLLDLLNIAAAFPKSFPNQVVSQLREKSQKALNWLLIMSHPDGKISFFNDSAFGIAASNGDIISYAAKLGVTQPRLTKSSFYLEASGYARLTAGPAQLFVDLARIGPDYLPGHAHADTLSFELSLFRQRLFVNTGTSEYEDSLVRQEQRGTAAHNCVVAGGGNSSEVWGAFRVGRRAIVQEPLVRISDGVCIAEGYHDGYVHLSGGGLHKRRFVLDARSLSIEDRFTGNLPAEAWYHLHPDVKVTATGERTANLALSDGNNISLSCEGGALRFEREFWHHEFGRASESLCMILPLVEGRAMVHVDWN